MFSNVNEVVEQARLAEEGDYQFGIDWRNSCYRDPERQEDPWEYFFEPCFPIPTGFDLADSEVLPGGASVAVTRANIITPRIKDGVLAPLLLPHDRLGAHALVSRYIRLKPHMRALIEMTKASLFRSQMIGLHIRGPGRTDGGVSKMRERFGSKHTVPFEPFFTQTDYALKLVPEAGIFACSDSNTVIEAIVARYGGRVVTRPALRSRFGEMHANHAENNGLNFDPYTLGVDVVCDAWLLSQADIFIHGNSNVANFVLCQNPYLIHAYVQA